MKKKIVYKELSYKIAGWRFGCGKNLAAALKLAIVLNFGKDRLESERLVL
jgi:hypothetical protein